MRATLVVLLGLVAVSSAQMILTSDAFKSLESIPPKYCCDAVKRDEYKPSPPLKWFRAPARAQSFVLLMDDMDADGFVHWLVKDIPRHVTSLDAGWTESGMPAGSIELMNSNGYDSYSGPCPYNETHNYRFRLFAMPTAQTYIRHIENPATLRSSDIVSQIQDDALYVAVLVGKYYLPAYVPPAVKAPSSWNATSNYTRYNSTNPRREDVLHKLNTTYWRNNTNTTHHQHRRTPKQEVPTRRYIKPSEVLKRIGERGLLSSSIPVACTENGVTSADCVIALAEQQTNSTAPNAKQLPTQMFVSQQVKRFVDDIDLWDCEEEYKRQGGIRIVNDQRQRCPMRVRVTDAPCEHQTFPRQYVCQHNATTGEMGQSPSVMWKDAPNATQSFVVMLEEASPPPYVDDYGKVYWLVSNIHPSVSSIVGGASGRDGLMPPLSTELRNSMGQHTYTPPCPDQHSVRDYRIHVFAMPHPEVHLDLGNDFRASAVISQLERHALCSTFSELKFSFKEAQITTPHIFKTSQPQPADLAAGEEVGPN